MSTRRIQPDRKVVFEDVLPVDASLTEVRSYRIRVAFSTLLDAAARAVQSAGFDLDDVIVERLLVDSEGEVYSFESIGNATSSSARRLQESVRIVELRVIAVRDFF